MQTDAREAHAIKPELPACFLRIAGHQDLTALRRLPDAPRVVHGHSDVVVLGTRRVAAVNTDPDPYLEPLRPRTSSELTLDGHRRIERGPGTLEHREEVVGPRLDHVTAGTHGLVPEDRAHSVDQLAVAVAQTIDQRGGAFDIGHQH